MKNKKIVFLPIFVFSVLALLSGAILISSRKKVDNIFSYAIKVTDGKYSHTYLDFFTTKDVVLKKVRIRRKATIEHEVHANDYVASKFELTGLSNKVFEKCIMENSNTGEEILVAVSYFMTVTEDEIEEFIITLYEQAKEHMPIPTDGDLEKIREGELHTLYWIDEQDSHVTVSFTENYDSDNLSIILQVTCPKNLMKHYVD